jgi:hypothetical protein
MTEYRVFIEKAIPTPQIYEYIVLYSIHVSSRLSIYSDSPTDMGGLLDTCPEARVSRSRPTSLCYHLQG